MGDPRRRTLALRGGMSLLLLAFVLSRTDVGRIGETLQRAQIGLLALALVIFLTYQVTMAVNWQALLVVRSIRIPFRDLLRLHFIGLFYNLFLPTSVGGDLAKIMLLRRRIGSGAESMASLGLLRGLGLITNLALVVIGALLAPGLVQGSEAAVLVAGTGTALAALAIVPRVGEGILTRPLFARSPWVQRIVGGIIRAVRSMAASGSRPVRLLPSLGLSLGNQILIVAQNYLLARALAIPVSFGSLMVIIPLTFVVTLLPITLSGVGLREGAFALFFHRLGLPVAEAVSLSLVGYSMVLLAGAMGAVVSARDRLRITAAEADRQGAVVP